MDPNLLTKLTANVQEFVQYMLMEQTDIPRIGCATLGLDTAAAFQNMIKERVGTGE